MPTVLHETDSGRYTCVAEAWSGRSQRSASLLVVGGDDPQAARNFHRAAAPSALPAPPTRPRVTDLTNASVTLVWSPPHTVGEAPLLGYTLESYTSTGESRGGIGGGGGRGKWRVVARGVARPRYTAPLEAGRPQVFVVRAESSLGESPPSPWSQVVMVGGSMAGGDAGGGGGGEDDSGDESLIPTRLEQPPSLVGRRLNLTGLITLSSSSMKVTWKVRCGGSRSSTVVVVVVVVKIFYQSRWENLYTSTASI